MIGTNRLTRALAVSLAIGLVSMLVAAGSMATAAIASSTTTLTFTADADARVDAAHPTTNYGTSFLRADTGSDANVESFLHYTVTGVSGTVQTAKLRVSSLTNGTVNGPAIYGANNSWTETGITWNNRPARTSAATDNKGAIGANSWVEYNVAPLVTGNGAYSFVLAADDSDGVTFSSREGSAPPQLVLTIATGSTTTPTPTSKPPTPSPTTVPPTPSPNNHSIKTVFVILMENHNWSAIKGSTSAPYINQTLLPQASYTQQYFNPPGVHPSEPNYLWLEAGTGFGITNDSNPSTNHQSTTNHLVTQLKNAGISWKAYQEDISGTVCPLTGSGLYAPRHNPMVFFDDVTGTNNPNSAYCIAHERPYTELATDLQNNTVARYNFITPNLCNDMHDSSGCATSNSVKNGDTWLSKAVPQILNSQAYKNGGALFITWDEGEGSDGPIGMIVLSANAKGGGYSNAIHYTHSSTLRTVQEIFGVTPLLGDAAKATDLRDLFKVFP